MEICGNSAHENKFMHNFRNSCCEKLLMLSPFSCVVPRYQYSHLVGLPRRPKPTQYYPAVLARPPGRQLLDIVALSGGSDSHVHETVVGGDHFFLGGEHF